MSKLMMDSEPLAKDTIEAIRTGDTERLKSLLVANDGLAQVRIETRADNHRTVRSLLHIACDWPGFIPNGSDVLRMLIEAGADVNARFEGGHSETPLHWAASNNDVEALDVLLDAGADIEADGAVIGGGTALSDAVAFGQWAAARRLVERGAKQLLWHAAALGNMTEVRLLAEPSLISSTVSSGFRGSETHKQQLTQAFWLACHGGQRESAEYLWKRGADMNRIGYDGLTPLDAARRSEANELADWLVSVGARSAGA